MQAKTHPNAFPKAEHLCGEMAVSTLFRQGKSLLVYPLKVHYMVVKDNVPVKCLVWAPKKNFKRAVDRVRLRRQMREAYRKNKQPLFSMAIAQQMQLHVAFRYIASDMLPTHLIERKMVKAIARIIENVQCN